MANRRMFAKTIIDSDAFLDMPLSTQALYFHLSMRAGDLWIMAGYHLIEKYKIIGYGKINRLAKAKHGLIYC